MKCSLVLLVLQCLASTLFAQPANSDSLIQSVFPDDSFAVADEEPIPLNKLDIQRLIGYPRSARENEIGGEVITRILVDSSGNYVTHKLVQTAAPILDEAVEREIHLLKFKPAMRAGKTIPFWVNVPFRFKIITEAEPQSPILNPSVVSDAPYPEEAL